LNWFSEYIPRQTADYEKALSKQEAMMRNAMVEFMLNLLIVMLIAVVQTQALGSPIAKTITNNQAPPQVINDDEKIQVAPPDKSEEHFHKARASFLKRDTKAAAAEIRKEAAFLKLEASHATGQAKKALTASVRELEKLAEGVEKGTVTSGQDLRRAFARAVRALAEEHLQNAVESWSKREVKKAGQALNSAADDVELALSWAGHKLNTTTSAAVEGAHAVAARLTEGAGWTREEVGKGLDAMSKEIEKLREQV